MIDETYVLVMLVLLMLVGSYIVGSIPLIMKLSEEKLKLITVLGAGLLVGTALTVIIPEGVRSLHASQKRPDVPSPAIYKYTIASAPLEKINDYSQTIGISLVLGFVFMMLIDQFSQKRQNSLAVCDKAITATLGLVVHAAADGVALGAVATTSHHDVEIIVFFAIMLHKAPAAFGLVSFLLHEKTERQKIRKHLIIFSISAPLFTLLTYFCIGQEHKETLNSLNATGITMLFSAGTFLYVATVHVLPQLIHNGIEHKQQEQRYGEHNYHLYENVYGTVEMQTSIISAPPKSTGLYCCELLIMICGTILPLVITLCHKHY